MQIICIATGIQFSGSNQFASLPTYYDFHPFLKVAKEKRIIFEPFFSSIRNIQRLNEDELKLAVAACLVNFRDKVEFSAPINPPPSLSFEYFFQLREAANWLSQLPELYLCDVPKYRVTKETASLAALVDGYLAEIMDLKDAARRRAQRDYLDRREQALARIIARRKMRGLPLLSDEVIDWTFHAAEIPAHDRDHYKYVLTAPFFELMTAKDFNILVSLSDLEEYVEDWLSHSIVKVYALKAIRERIAEARSYGCCLPASYYIKDETSGELVTEYKTNSWVKESIQFSPVDLSTIAATSTHQQTKMPKRSDYASPVEYRKAFSTWLQTSTNK